MQQIRHGRAHEEGAKLDHVRLNEIITHAAFGGRRRRVYAGITALSGAQPGDRVLDIGCCGGYLARLLAAAVGPAGRVTGVDPSGTAVRYAERRAPANCTFRVGVAQSLDLPDQSFDVVTTTLAVHHIPETQRAPSQPLGATVTPSRSRTWRPRPASASRPAASCHCCAMSGPSGHPACDRRPPHSPAGE